MSVLTSLWHLVSAQYLKFPSLKQIISRLYSRSGTIWWKVKVWLDYFFYLASWFANVVRLYFPWLLYMYIVSSTNKTVAQNNWNIVKIGIKPRPDNEWYNNYNFSIFFSLIEWYIDDWQDDFITFLFYDGSMQLTINKQREPDNGQMKIISAHVQSLIGGKLFPFLLSISL